MLTHAPTREETRAHRRRETSRLFDELQGTADPVERERLLEELIVINMEVAQTIAQRFKGRGVPIEDLEQVAYAALVGAVRRFDLAHDRDFLAYAVPTISGELKRYFRDHGWTVRPPRRIQEVHSDVSRCYARRLDAGEPTSPSAIAAELQIDVGVVAEALRAKGCFQPTSLDAAVLPEEGSTLISTLKSDDDAAHEAVEARAILEPVLRRLSARDRMILRMRFIEEQTQQEIGQRIGVTQMQVSRLLDRILRDLRSAMVTEA